MICTEHYYSVDQIKKDERGGAFGNMGGETYNRFGGEMSRKETTWKT
jgi:hypothetical protein